jgi:lactobin A/cerein 7B family class IIb bacteriocin
MSTTVGMRDLTASELDEVSGGIWHIVGRIVVGIAVAMFENQQHNGEGSVEQTVPNLEQVLQGT